MSTNGTRTLLCSEDTRLRSVLPDAEVAREAIELIERGSHEVVVLDASTDRQTTEALRSTMGARRRDLFVVLVSDHVTTGDGEQAWRESVDMVVHADDVSRLPDLLREGREAKRRLCGRFRSMSLERGDG
ncbi:MAG: hypothetical protein ACYTGZ_01625 [Planctomycetota bacterium]|jgi:DNA-binding NarL/FixJ family response regulator